MLTSREDVAKYPFTREAATYVKGLDLKIDEMASPEYINVVDRAEQRVEDALIHGIVKTANFQDKEIEILSFPVAVLLVAKIGDDFLKRRYTLAEAKRAYEILRNDNESKLIEIAKTTFSWEARIEKFYILLSLIDYLRNSTDFHDDSWKLINKTLLKGEVILRKEEFARLLQEEIRKHIENVIKSSPRTELNASLTRTVERINQILAQRRRETQVEEFPKSAVSIAYPPCVKRLYDSLLTGQHISHMGRFTLTSFLLNVGVKADELTEMYTSISDFDEKLTQYQVEHIAGEKGSRIRYTPPNCSTLKTHGLCQSTDELCTRIRHPLSYYRRKLRLIKVPSG